MGKRKWKGGRYGKGQLILLADSDHLVVLSGNRRIGARRSESDKAFRTI